MITRPASQALAAHSATTAAYRVVVRLSGGGLALVSLARTLAQASAIARRFRNAAQDPPGPRYVQVGAARRRLVAVLTQEWVGGAADGRWRPIGDARGGFSFAFPVGEASERRAAQPQSGDLVECVLLDRKTRKGGWLARLADRPLEGPITNPAEVPSAARAGQRVVLRIGAIRRDGGRVQFHWTQQNGR
jgi:hypothetical protein